MRFIAATWLTMVVVPRLQDVGVAARQLVDQLHLHALGRQLDRRQRILDLVRQPARHLAPRDSPLRRNHLRDVVEHDDVARARRRAEGAILAPATSAVRPSATLPARLTSICCCHESFGVPASACSAKPVSKCGGKLAVDSPAAGARCLAERPDQDARGAEVGGAPDGTRRSSTITPADRLASTRSR